MLDLEAFSAKLDQATPQARLELVLALDPRAQADLFEAAAGFRAVTLDDLVPAPTAPMTGVAHEGRNSLWAFTRFAKVFYRPDDATAGGELWGFNRTSAVVATAVGPGYYVAYPRSPFEVLVDYLRLPPRPLPGGPKILSNSARLSRFVYHHTQDTLRGVSQHVSIGRAARDGTLLDNWFVLCRG